MVPPSRATAASLVLGAAPLPPDGPVGIYVHVPFCTHICPYCDFNTYAGQENLLPRYVAAAARELTTAAPAVAGRAVSSIYVGGGTPSLLSAGHFATLLGICASHYDLTPEIEITIEANPNGLTDTYLSTLRELGVNRLSLGAQTLDRRGLRTLGRRHEADDVVSAIAAARRAGFDNVSVDLIFGWPGQTLAGWERDLVALAPDGETALVDHLSLYSLIVEPGTPYAEAVARGVFQTATDDLSADMYELAMDRLARAGFIHYEVANWARDASVQSRHNRLYWLNGDYLGVGAGAHGYLHGERGMNHPLPARYCAALEAGESARSNAERITAVGAMGETMMLGLRLPRVGVSRSLFQRRHGLALDDVFGDVLTRFRKTGLMTDDGEIVRLTRSGLLLANEVCAEFLAAPADAAVVSAPGGGDRGA